MKWLNYTRNLLSIYSDTGWLRSGGVHYDFEFDFVREVFIANFGIERVLTIESMRSAVSLRRNSIEEAIRGFLYWETSKIDGASWENLIDNAIKSDRRNLVPNARVAFSRGGSPLYLIELVKIMKFLNVEIDGFNMSDIFDALNFINANRVDAHAKGISIESFDELMRKLDFLASAFSAPD